MKSIINKSTSLLLTVIMIFIMFIVTPMPTSATEMTGYCGNSVTYLLDSTGTLTITGNGSMYDYAYNESPFRENTSIKKIVINPGITSIGKNAFLRCENLNSVSIPDTVTSIGQLSFSSSKALKTISIPDSVKTINSQAFSYSGLESVSLGNGITEIKDTVFSCCRGLTSISFPDSLTEIGALAFSSCDNLQSLYIPKNVTTIGNYAFSGCGKLESIEVNEDNSKYDSRDNCNALIETDSNILIRGCKNTVIPNTVRAIGLSAFSDCEGLTTISLNDNITYIDMSAFNYCPDLASVSLPDTITYIGEGAFMCCTKLKQIRLSSQLNSICTELFRGCTSLESIVVPKKVKSIGTRAFMSCTNLSEVSIPDSVTYFGEQVFDGCQSLSDIIVPKKLSTLPNKTFEDCDSLTSITIPDSITKIGSAAFAYCDNLSSVTMSNSVTSIGERAFYECKNLKNLILPRSISSINANTFDSCGFEEFIIPNSITNIGKYAFFLNDLKSIVISDSVTNIEDYAFNCKTVLNDVYYTGSKEQWDSITIGSGNNYLTNANIHYNYSEHIHREVQHNPTCTEQGYKEYICVICGESSKGDYSDAYGHNFETEVVNPNRQEKGYIKNTCSVCGYTHTEEIPKLTYDEPLISGKLGDNAFYSFDNKTGILTISGTGALDKSVFGSDKFIKKVIIKNGITTIGYHMFSGCENLSDVEIPEGVTSIGEGAFMDCISLESIELPDSLNYIDYLAFLECFNLKSIYIPKNVKPNIASNAFESCYNLESIDVDPENNNYYSVDGVLYEKKGRICHFPPAKKAESYIIPEGVTSIFENAFLSCKNLTTLTLPKSLTYISGCLSGSGIKYVFYPGTKEEFDSISGSSVFSSNANIYMHYETNNHIWNNGETIVKATCTKEGIKKFTCSVCGETKTETIPSAGHSVITDEYKAPSCTEAGLTEGSHCSVCGEVLKDQEIIPATGHSYIEKTVEAYCNVAGYTEHICEICGDSYKDHYVDALSHDYKKTVIIEPTCTEKGRNKYTCSICQDSYTEEVDALGHTIVIDKAKPATCTETGLTEGSHCSVCHEVLKEQKVIPATGHKWDEGTVTKEPTCTENGVKTFTCENCKETKTEKIDALGHTVVKDEAKVATCTETGLTEGSHCSVCHAVIEEQETIPAIGHKWNEGEVTKEATYKEAGEMLYTCTECKETKTEVIPALEKKGKLVVSNEVVRAGDDVKVKLYIDKNPGITALSISVAFPDELKLKEIKYTELLSSKPSNSKDSTSPLIISWLSPNSLDEDDTGLFATLTFTADIDAEVSDYTVRVTYKSADIVDSTLDEIPFDIENGTVSVQKPTPGDVNRDGAINMKDLVLIQQLINKWDVNIVERAADVDDDGDITMKDLVILQQYINGWEVVLK